MDLVILGILIIFFFLLWLSYTRILGAEFYPTTRRKMEKMLEFATLKKTDVVYDLGCGDGRLVIAAARRCRKAIGIEIDPIRYFISNLKIKFLGLKSAKIVIGNLFNRNLKDADVVFLFLNQKSNNKLQEKFNRELKKGTRIVSHYWIFKGWKAVMKDEKLRIYLYVIGKSNVKSN